MSTVMNDGTRLDLTFNVLKTMIMEWTRRYPKDLRAIIDSATAGVVQFSQDERASSARLSAMLIQGYAKPDKSRFTHKDIITALYPAYGGTPFYEDLCDKYVEKGWRPTKEDVDRVLMKDD